MTAARAIAAGEGEVVFRAFGSTLVVKASGADTGGAASLIEVILEPAGGPGQEPGALVDLMARHGMEVLP